MFDHSPHATLLALHQLVDAALEPLLGPMGLRWATEGYLTVDRHDIDALAHAGDPQAALVGFDGEQAHGSGLLVAEPALCSALLARVWRSSRNSGAPLTQVEGEILRQFLADVVGAWRGTWSHEGVTLLPRLTMASSLPMFTPQLPDGPWHIARTVVTDDDSAVIGVLLFCYPAHLMPDLARQHDRITWRSRITRGLTGAERVRLEEKLNGPLRHLIITAPVTYTTEIPLGFLNTLERGDVITFDAHVGSELALRVLDRTVQARLARTSSNRLALAVAGRAGEEDHAGGADASGHGWDDASDQGGYAAGFDNESQQQHPDW